MTEDNSNIPMYELARTNITCTYTQPQSRQTNMGKKLLFSTHLTLDSQI